MRPLHFDKPDEKREAARIAVALAATVGMCNARTRDMSGNGIYFETDASFDPGNEVTFSIDLEHATASGILRLLCQGRIVRVERHGGKLGIAVAIESQRFQIVTANDKAEPGTAL